MKRILLAIIVSLLSTAGSVNVYADHHRGNGRDRYEHRDHNKYDRPGSNNPHKDFKNPGKRHDKFIKDQRKRDRKYQHHVDRELQKMIRYATRGSRDVKVWRINNDTYIVRFFRNGKFYTQKLYPYSGRYGAPGVISINWTPASFWTLIPSVNINIPLN